MKKIPPTICGTFTDKEIVQEVDHYFPNLGPLLKEMRDRLAREGHRGHRQVVENTEMHTCPQCGFESEVEVQS